MQVKRSELIDLLRAHEAEETALRAEQSLPLNIDLDRDNVLLRQLGIDPNVTAALLSAEDRSEPQAEALPQPSSAGSVAVDHPSADDSSTGHPLVLADVLPLVIQKPASWCPRCQMRFDSIDVMLDHLNGEHLRGNSLKGWHATPGESRLSLSTSEIDEALNDIARAFQEPAFQRPAAQEPTRRRWHLSLVTVIGPVLLVIGIVSLLAGETLGGAALIAVALLVAAAVGTVRRLRSAAKRTQTSPRAEGD